jgi:hypothetical protein
VAAETEHVRPGREPQPFQARELAEAEAFGDEAAGVVPDGKVSQPVGGGDAAVEGAGAFGGFGRVLGDVGGDLAVGQLSGGGDRAGVEFTSPGQRPGREARGGRDIQVDGAGGLVDGGGEQYKGRPSGRAVVGPVGPSSRMMAWKWTTPRRWYSATLAYETRTWAASALLVSPVWRARVRRSMMAKRRHSSGAQALNRTEPV